MNVFIRERDLGSKVGGEKSMTDAIKVLVGSGNNCGRFGWFGLFGGFGWFGWFDGFEGDGRRKWRKQGIGNQRKDERKIEIGGGNGSGNGGGNGSGDGRGNRRR